MRPSRSPRLRKETFTRWGAVDHLKTEAEIAAYLKAAMAEAGEDASYIASVLEDVVKARTALRPRTRKNQPRGRRGKP